MNTPKKHLPSRAVQIQVMSYAPSVNNGQCHSLFALCEDGTIWQQWHSLESANVPQDGLWHPVLANTASQRYEEKAEAFYRETGMMAPGKDSRDGAFSYEEREEAWREFVTKGMTGESCK